MASHKLSDAYITSKQREPAKGKRTLVMDTEHPRLGLRVTDSGHRSFVYVGRFGGSPNPTRRLIGTYPAMYAQRGPRDGTRLGQAARRVAPIQPSSRSASSRSRSARPGRRCWPSPNTFEARARQYLREHCKDHRRAHETGRLIDREVMPAWRDRRIDQITSREIKEHDRQDRRALAGTAHKHARRCQGFFAWAFDLEHVDTSPAASIRPEKLIGEQKATPAHPDRR